MSECGQVARGKLTADERMRLFKTGSCRLFREQQGENLILGYLNVDEYLRTVQGRVVGCVVTDAKNRQYRREYVCDDAGDKIVVRREDGKGDAVSIPKRIELDESLVAFFGLYSGDGAKGSEDRNEVGRIVPTISFSQKEKHLVRFAVDQFRLLCHLFYDFRCFFKFF